MSPTHQISYVIRHVIIRDSPGRTWALLSAYRNTSRKKRLRFAKLVEFWRRVS